MYEIENINGATLIYSRRKGMETASAGVFVKAGGRHEPKEIKGIAHFVEHLLFKGSAKYSYKKIKQEIEGRGGSLNGYTSQENTGYYAQFLRKNLNLTLDILLDMVCRPLFKFSDIDKERRVVLEEIKMYNDLPSPKANSILEKLLWPGHPLGDEIIGSKESVEAISRKDFLKFKKDYYCPSNIVVSCSGDFDKKEAVDKVREKVFGFPGGLSAVNIAPQKSAGLKVEVEIKQLEQSYLCLGFRGPSYLSRDRFAVEILNIILGGNMSSRLFEAVREKKALCYDVSSEARKYYDSGAFVVCLGLDKSKVETALNAILRELVLIKREKVLKDELSRAKDYLLGQIAMSLEKPQGRMFYLADSYLTLGKIDEFARMKFEIESITAEHIKKLALEIFDFKNMCVSAVGNFHKDIEGKIRNIVI